MGADYLSLGTREILQLRPEGSAEISQARRQRGRGRCFRPRRRAHAKAWRRGCSMFIKPRPYQATQGRAGIV